MSSLQPTSFASVLLLLLMPIVMAFLVSANICVREHSEHLGTQCVCVCTGISPTNKLKRASDVRRFAHSIVAIVAGECHWIWTWIPLTISLCSEWYIASTCTVLERTSYFPLSFSIRTQPFRIHLLRIPFINYSFARIFLCGVLCSLLTLLNRYPSICTRCQRREHRHRFATGVGRLQFDLEYFERWCEEAVESHWTSPLKSSNRALDTPNLEDKLSLLFSTSQVSLFPICTEETIGKEREREK